VAMGAVFVDGSKDKGEGKEEINSEQES